MLKILFFFTTIGLITSCEQKTNNELKPETKANKNSFFPVTQYLLGQIKDLDTMPVTPLKITTINGIADSAWLKREDIRPFIHPFISPVIDSTGYNAYFSEKSFLDQTLNAFTFSYDPTGPLPTSMEVKRWDIYVDPATQKVNRIYIVKEVNHNASLQTIQLVWKSGYYCQITTISEKKGEAPKIKEEKLIWDFNK